jgi:hypothetical protein
VCSPFNCHYEHPETSNQNSRYCSLLYLDTRIMAISKITPTGKDVIPGNNVTYMHRGAKKCMPLNLTVLPFDKVALAFITLHTVHYISVQF